MQRFYIFTLCFIAYDVTVVGSHWLGGKLVSTNMNEAMKDEAIFVSDEALRKFDNWNARTLQVEDHFGKTYGGVWNCFIGKTDQFADAIRGIEDYYFVYKLGDTQMVLFRSRRRIEAAQKMKEMDEQAKPTNDELTRIRNMPRESSSEGGGFFKRIGGIAGAAAFLPFLG
ncbi:hypothetical protein HDE_00950 [Halotydeus destructor]|nr:hypothetical protein HDE_00950 [Halotydeus destructor]